MYITALLSPSLSLTLSVCFSLSLTLSLSFITNVKNRPTLGCGPTDHIQHDIIFVVPIAFSHTTHPACNDDADRYYYAHRPLLPYSNTIHYVIYECVGILCSVRKVYTTVVLLLSRNAGCNGQAQTTRRRLHTRLCRDESYILTYACVCACIRERVHVRHARARVYFGVSVRTCVRTRAYIRELPP